MNKYKINFYLDQLTHKEYNKATKNLPSIIGVSRRTFDRWRNLEYGSKTDASLDKMYLIATYLQVGLEDLFQKKPTPIEMPVDDLTKKAQQYGLSM